MEIGRAHAHRGSRALAPCQLSDTKPGGTTPSSPRRLVVCPPTERFNTDRALRYDASARRGPSPRITRREGVSALGHRVFPCLGSLHVTDGSGSVPHTNVATQITCRKWLAEKLLRSLLRKMNCLQVRTPFDRATRDGKRYTIYTILHTDGV